MRGWTTWACVLSLGCGGASGVGETQGEPEAEPEPGERAAPPERPLPDDHRAGQRLGEYALFGGWYLSHLCAPDTDPSWQPESLTVGDLDGDGDDDVVARSGCGLHTLIREKERLVEEKGSRCTAVPQAGALQLADVNGDGKADLATFAGCGLQTWIRVGASWAPEACLEVRGEAAHLADVNGDGKADALIRRDCGLEVRLRASGGWGAPVGCVAAPAGRVAVAEVTGDGQVDRLVLGPAPEVRPGDGKGGFGDPIALPDALSGLPAARFAVADTDDDRRAELLSVAECGLQSHTFDGSAWSAEACRPLHLKAPSAIHVTEANGDGRDDLLLVGEERFELLGRGFGVAHPAETRWGGVDAHEVAPRSLRGAVPTRTSRAGNPGVEVVGLSACGVVGFVPDECEIEGCGRQISGGLGGFVLFELRQGSAHLGWFARTAADFAQMDDWGLRRDADHFLYKQGQSIDRVPSKSFSMVAVQHGVKVLLDTEQSWRTWKGKRWWAPHTTFKGSSIPISKATSVPGDWYAVTYEASRAARLDGLPDGYMRLGKDGEVRWFVTRPIEVMGPKDGRYYSGDTFEFERLPSAPKEPAQVYPESL